MEKIFLMVCTVDKNILSNSKLLNIPLNENLKMVISNQMINDKSPLEINNPYITVLNINEKGISKNRNNILKQLNNGFGIIADDDVFYEDNFEEIIIKAINNNPEIDVFCFKALNNDKAFKNYPQKSFTLFGSSFLNRKKLMNFSSIEIVLNLKSISKNNLNFNENFGVGSNKYKMGEEVLFLKNCLKKGLKIKYIPEYIVNHQDISTGKKINSNFWIAYSRICKELFGFLGMFLSIWVLFKKTLKGNSKVAEFGNNIKLIFKEIIT